MSICQGLSVCLSVCLSLCLYVGVFVSSYVYMWDCLSLCLLASLFLCLSTSLSLCLYIHKSNNFVSLKNLNIFVAVDSNDSMYGNDPKFVAEVKNMASTLIGEILAHLKTISNPEVCQNVLSTIMKASYFFCSDFSWLADIFYSSIY